jgi:cytochrome oxidase Cu insertion factor (SCO1/SenC/PrrC family)
MRLNSLIWSLLISLSATLHGAHLQDAGPEHGKAIAAIRWVDSNGQPRNLSEFAGHPVILLPIYSRCQATCVQNVAGLKRALAESNADPKDFRVLLFSFDETDTPETLRAFHKRENVPLGWFIGTSDQVNIEALTESIGFQYGKAGGEFIHPDLLLFLDSRLKIAKWIYGNHYRARDVDSALAIAAGRSDWLGRWATVIYGLLVFAVSIFLIALVHLLLERKRLGSCQELDGGIKPPTYA